MPQTRSSARGKAPAQSDTAATASGAQDAQTATTASSSRLASNVRASTSQGARQAGGEARKEGSKKRKSGGRKKRSRQNEDDEDADAGGESSRRPAKRKKGKRRIKVEELSDSDDGLASDDGGQPPTPPPKDARWLPPPEPVDRLTDLPRELLQQILSCVLLPSEAGGAPDRHSLAQLALANRKLAVQVRSALYRELDIDTRVQAHAIHRTLHGRDMARGVKRLTANIESMVKTSSSWPGWFTFHSMHSLCGILGSCRHLLSVSLYLITDTTAWMNSLCQALIDLRMLQEFNKDLAPSGEGDAAGAGSEEGMDIGWKPSASPSMLSVSQFVKPLSTLKSLRTLRLCGISSDSSTLPHPPLHSLKLTEVVLVEVNVTNHDLIQLLGDARSVKKFTLWRSSLLSKRGLVHVLKKCPALIELRVGGSWFGAKAEDDKHFPLNEAFQYLPHLKLVHVSGSLISPAALELPNLCLNHLFVHRAPSWKPAAVHASLSKMSHDPPAVARLTLPAMRDPRKRKDGEGGRRGRSRSEAAQGVGEGWNETWRFTVQKTGEAKGCLVEDRWRKDGDDDSDTIVLDDSDSEV
ncbi:hypothetical protein RTBOTA2_006855 [Rhodotorula toruloides]|uniref:Uncharacterized protein n=1 Tax=Rhodotorula toruloides TaxID=5286 RepID=A0A2T0AC27_RHOTO|nr:hypothetical protein RTBOTA2_006855 [Rhodotorula toruloides]PRQ75543.1 hypothetical protein AAT19DRAFT_13600 [Rhodotorula toruloides]